MLLPPGSLRCLAEISTLLLLKERKKSKPQHDTDRDRYLTFNLPAPPPLIPGYIMTIPVQFSLTTFAASYIQFSVTHFVRITFSIPPHFSSKMKLLLASTDSAPPNLWEGGKFNHAFVMMKKLYCLCLFKVAQSNKF